MIEPQATATAAHRPPETVIDRLPPLGFPDADALGLDVELPPAEPTVALALEVSPGDAVVTVAWVAADPLGVVVGSPAAGPAGALVAEPTPLQVPCEIKTLGQ